MAGINVSYLINYPVELTDKDWQKKKGLMAKTVKTGLKAELDKGEKLHKLIDTAKLLPTMNSPKTMEDLATGIKEAKSNYAKMVEPLISQLKTIVATAKKAEIALTKAKYTDAAKAAATIAKTADLFAVTCKSITFEDEVKEAEKRIKMRVDLAVKELKPSIDKFRKGAGDYVDSPGTKTDWDTLVKQHGRSVSNCVSTIEIYRKEFWKDFEKFKGFDSDTLKIGSEDPKHVTLRLKVLQLALAKVKEIADFKPK